jgi:glyoxylase-like metal-dependent hydrolase (beta-lactamase superfamily II)
MSDTLGRAHAWQAGFHRFKIGTFDAVSIYDGSLPFEHIRYGVVPEATDEEYASVLKAHAGDDDMPSLHVNTLYVDTGRNKALIDTGAGPALGPLGGLQKANLERAGIDRAAIDAVVLSHGHLDHLGGIVDANDNLNFPNARFYISKTEWDFWTADEVKNGQRLPDDMKAQAEQFAKQQLGAIKDRVTVIAPGTEFLPSIEAIDARGHSVGQLAFKITSGKDSIVFTADTVHTPAISLAHPDWINGFDDDQEVGRRTRKEFMERFAKDGSLVIVPHFPFPGIGRIAKAGSGYAWQPES